MNGSHLMRIHRPVDRSSGPGPWTVDIFHDFSNRKINPKI
jgi:hypothetical protein